MALIKYPVKIPEAQAEKEEKSALQLKIEKKITAELKEWKKDKLG